MIGKSIGRYTVIDKLGKGGMGTVWKAEDTTLGRMVALKFLSSDLPDDEERARFLREARAASALDHPGICTIYEAEEDEDGRPYLVMAYCEGESLRERIAKGPLLLDESLRIAIQIGEALARAHEKGIVHRDIKPGNLLFSSEGTPKITDFGLAAYQGATRLTKTGSSMGTVAYASPEQLTGQEVDRRADIWSLGVVLYEMLVGMVPFSAEHEQGVVHKILSEDVEPVTARRAGIPLELDRILSKALAKDPEQRYQYVEDMLVDLKQLLSTMVTPKPQDSAFSITSFSRAQKSRQWLMYAIPAVFIAGVAIAINFGTGRVRGDVPLLAVLAFESQGNPAVEYLERRMVNDIRERFRGVGGVKIVPHNAILNFQREGKTALDIADEVGATHVLAGITLWQADAENGWVQIAPELINVAGTVATTLVTYELALPLEYTDISEASGGIAKEVLEAIRPGTEETMEVPTESEEAWQAYTQGLHYLARMFDGASNRIAIQMFERAVEHDSTFALAWAALARPLIYGKQYSNQINVGPREIVPVNKAVEYAPGIPATVLARGYLAYWGYGDLDEGRELFEEVIASTKSSLDEIAEARKAIGYIARKTGDWVEAENMMRQALDLDPTMYEANLTLGQIMQWTRRYGEAESYYRRAIDIAPEVGPTYRDLTILYLSWNGDRDRARDVMRTAPLSFRRSVARQAFPRHLLLVRNLPDLWEQDFVGHPNPDTPRWRLWNLVEYYTAISQDEIAKEIQQLWVQQIVPNLNPVSEDLAYAAIIHTRLGMETEARTFLSRALGTSDVFVNHPHHGWRGTAHIALACLHLGEIDEGLRWVRRLLDRPSLYSVTLLETDPAWESFHDIPEFQALLDEYRH